jgi:FHA domain/Transcriptional regulatory protein, C terminal
MPDDHGTVPPIHAALLQSTVSVKNRILLNQAFIQVGRGVSGESAISIALDDTQVSREHAHFIFEADRWLLEDCSRNGTLINGKVIHQQRITLHPGDRIQIGVSFDFTFQHLGATQDTLPEANVHLPLTVSSKPETPPDPTGIWISPSAAIWRDGVCLPMILSRTEYRLLKFLAYRAGDVCDYESTIHAVWGIPREKDSLHELIYRVRRKIESDPAVPRYLIIRSGIGVVFFPRGIDNPTS